MTDGSSFPLLDPKTLVPTLSPTLVVDGAGLEKVRQYLQRVTTFTYDFETNVVPTFYKRRVRTLQLGDRNEQYVIDFLAFAETPEALYAAQGGYRRPDTVNERHKALLQPIMDVVTPVLQSNSHLKIGHNLEFEYTTGKWCLGIRAWHYFCTMIGERVLTNGRVNAMQAGHFALDDLVRKYCRMLISKEEQTSFNLHDPLTEKQVIYCALDCRLPFSIKAAQDVQIDRDGLRRVIEIENDAIPAFGDMHLNGMWVNPENWAAIIRRNEGKLVEALAALDSFFLPLVGKKPEPFSQEEFDRLKADVERLTEKTPEERAISEEIRRAGKNQELKAELVAKRATLEEARNAQLREVKEEFKKAKSKGTKKQTSELEKMQGDAAINYGSHQQLLAALHKGPWGLTEKNLPSTNDKKMIKHSKLPVIQAIQDHRTIEKQLSTYGEAWIKTRDEGGFVDPDTGRIHARFLQIGADTGRPSCVKPNLLNLTRDDDVRGSFQSRPGYKMVCKDCAGQELRILAEYSQEPSWLGAFRRNQDLHSISGEMLSPDTWRKAALTEEKQIIKDGKVSILPPCAYYTKDKQKCACPSHKKERDKLKNINFGVAYGKQAYSFSLELGISVEEADALLQNWHGTFKVTSLKLEQMREAAYTKGEARDLAGRRRFVGKVSWEQAEESAKAKFGRESVSQDEVRKTYQSLMAAVKREAGNFPIQASGAAIMKRAMGCGFDKDGKPYLWHLLEPEYGGLLENYIYDELIVETPEAYAEAVSEEVSDAIIRAGAEFVKSVPMVSEGMVSNRWKK